VRRNTGALAGDCAFGERESLFEAPGPHQAIGLDIWEELDISPRAMVGQTQCKR